jgi:hypothetical protein
MLLATQSISSDAVRAGSNLPDCQIISKLLQDARQNFKTAVDERAFTVGRQADLGAKSCALALVKGARRQLYCRWTFAYRSGEARAWLQKLDRRIHECVSLPIEVIDDTAVNHPDTFEQRRYLFGKNEISLSAKDKAANDQSHVFFSLTGAGSE